MLASRIRMELISILILLAGSQHNLYDIKPIAVCTVLDS